MLADADAHPTLAPGGPGSHADSFSLLTTLLHPLTMRIWWQWMLVSLVAGIGAHLVLTQAETKHSIEQVLFAVGPLLATIVVVSVAQAVILRYCFPNWLWWLATIPAGLALAVATNLVLLRPLSAVFAAGGSQSNDLVVAVEVVIASAWIGSLQAALLAGDHVSHAGRWPLAVLVGIGGGVVVGNAYPLPYLGGAGTFALVCGLVTATAICWLLPDAAPAGSGFGVGDGDPAPD